MDDQTATSFGVRTRVLVVEDDAPIRRFLRTALSNEAYEVAEADTGRLALSTLRARMPDLILLDLGLPDFDGMELIGQVREWSQVPIVVLTARGRESDKVEALDAGADDYVTKPFGVPELLARIRATLRRSAALKDAGSAVATRLAVGDLLVDLEARRVFRGQTEIHLTPIEYRLLATLVRHAGKVLTHRFLLQEVWGPGCLDQTHYPRMFVASLRRKLEPDPAQPRYILTEQGVGYRLVEE